MIFILWFLVVCLKVSALQDKIIIKIYVSYYTGIVIIILLYFWQPTIDMFLLSYRIMS